MCCIVGDEGTRDGFDMIWLDGLIIGAFERFEEDVCDGARESVKATCANRNWAIVIDKGDYVEAIDRKGGSPHIIKLIWVQWLPRYESLPVYSNTVSDVLF